MEELLKAYMDQAEEYWSDDNTIYGYELNGHICEVRYSPNGEGIKRGDTINIWSIVQFLFEQQNLLKQK